MRITWFKDEEGRNWEGIDQGDGTARLIAGNLLSGKFKVMDETKPIAKRMTPLAPHTIFCIGLNYAEHASERGEELPGHPCLFMKPISTLNHPGDPIRIPRSSTVPEVDYEAELAVIIGKVARDVSERDALDHVLGYTCANDVSARWWQRHGGGGQFVRGKSFDTFLPIGPVIVTPDEIPDPQALRIQSILNGKVMQEDTTANMIFPVRELIARLSRDTTLIPGTAILTGTPSGVGSAHDPPVFLKHGDTITVRIETIGELTNPVVGSEA